MAFLWWRSRRSSSSGGADIEPQVGSPAVRGAHSRYRDYASRLVDEASEEFGEATELVIMTLDVKSQLRAHVGQLRIQVRNLENQLAILRACGGATGPIEAQLRTLRTQLGRSEQQLNGVRSGLDAEKMGLQMAKAQLHRDWPNRHNPNNFR